MRTMILVVAALILSMIYVYTDWLVPARGKATAVSAPFYWLADLPAKATEWADNRFVSKARLARENEALRAEILVYQGKLQQLASLAADNVRLRQLMNSAETLQDRVLIAELIGISPDPMVHKVVLNKGSRDGVYLGQALLDASGLMGQVVEVGASTSQVLLITDTTHALPVQINRNGVRLVAEGVGSLYELALRHVPNTLDIRAGDLLVSSGLGQRFPVGYPVAEVVDVITDPGKPFARVAARPMAQMNRSRYVLLVFDRKAAQAQVD